jgi:hypothetical protein
MATGDDLADDVKTAIDAYIAGLASPPGPNINRDDLFDTMYGAMFDFYKADPDTWGTSLVRSGSVTLTYVSSQNGNINGLTNQVVRYERIGNVVHVFGRVTPSISAAGNIAQGTGIFLSGLPFDAREIHGTSVDQMAGTFYVYGALGSQNNGMGFCTILDDPDQDQFAMYVMMTDGATSQASPWLFQLSYLTDDA